MVGLNHEFARKLLWREYPTDQRGSYFRQFWDVRELHRLRQAHCPSNRSRRSSTTSRSCTAGPQLRRSATTTTASPGRAGEQAVLVIRGELLKKYPTAVIYAHRADWARKPDGTIDLTKPRTLDAIADAEREPAAPTRSGRRCTRPRPIPTSTSSAST